MLGHLAVAERAVSNLIGHVRTSGPRLDLAQLALTTETAAHCLMMLMHHDPFLAFYWGALPFGVVTAFICGAIVLTCSSTLLLAAFWHQMIAQDGLASFACESRLALVLAGFAMMMNFLVCYFIITEVSQTANNIHACIASQSPISHTASSRLQRMASVAHCPFQLFFVRNGRHRGERSLGTNSYILYRLCYSNATLSFKRR